MKPFGLGPTNALYRIILPMVYKITCPSNTLFLELARRLPYVRKKMITIPYGGVELTMFRDSQGYKHIKPYIFCAARLVFEKGVDMLLMAFGKIVQLRYDIDLIIAGTGPAKRHLVHLAGLLGLDKRVIFLDSISHKVISSLYKGCKFFVMPSRIEGFGIAILEAMASGKSVIAFNVGAIPEIVKHEKNGLLVPAFDIDGFSDAMKRLLDDRNLLKRLESNASVTVSCFPWKDIAEAYLESYI
jgi:glycosyltransferase involved in cell wall biosynthesis